MRQRHVVRHSIQSEAMPEPEIRYAHPECMADIHPLEIIALIQEPENAALDVSTDGVKETLMVISPLDCHPQTKCIYCSHFVSGTSVDQEILDRLHWERRS